MNKSKEKYANLKWEFRVCLRLGIVPLTARYDVVSQELFFLLYFPINAVPEFSSMSMPNPSALFCLSNAFRSRTLKANTQTYTDKI